MSNDGNRGRYWTLNRVLDWVTGYNPAFSLDRILAELYELCLSGRVRARLPVTRNKDRLVPDAPFDRIPPVSDRLLRTRRAIVVAKEAQGPDHGLNTLGILGNVG